jgi:hypothetical protein
MKWIAMLCLFFILTNCRNGRDALESHQVIAEPSQHWVHWSKEEKVDVTAEKQVKSIKPCQQLS